MEVKLISHINGDGDLLPAWFQYYTALGVTSFHIIVHGSKEENASLFDLARYFPITIEAIYKGEFKSEFKRDYLQACVKSMEGNWLLLVDSDEFVELPYNTLGRTITTMECVGANTLFAPMIQRIKADGTLDSPAMIKNPFIYFPLCSTNLYQQLGVNASVSKYPLFFCDHQTFIAEGGNHTPPNGLQSTLAGLLGVTHHFKWKRSVLDRLTKRANSTHTFRQESVQYLDYLERNNFCLPTAGAFPYSRQELRQRGLLRRAGNPKEVFEEFDWYRKSATFSQTLRRVLSEENEFVLVDENQLGVDALAGLKPVHFLAREGQYWGAPIDDETAIKELINLQQQGMQFIVFAWPAFWWFQHYTRFKAYLDQHFRPALVNDSLLAYQLNG